jgi:branched-chain amino acid transport system ATP-binding protein
MLEITDLRSGYGDVEILQGITLRVEDKQVVSIVGANGAGKTTTLLTLSGLITPSAGSIKFFGQTLVGHDPSEIVQQGIAHVPEGWQLFTNMTVLENLELGAYTAAARVGLRERLEFVYDLFPRLRERRQQNAGTLSGGERQMVAIGRGLMLRPKLLVLDEPSLGLSPKLVSTMFKTIERIRAEGVAILLVEQNLVQSLKYSDYAYVMETGRVVLHGPSKELLEDSRTRQAFLGLYEAEH